MKNAGQASKLQMSRSQAYVASIFVGTPPQTMRCLLDSGSADLWVPSKKCRSCVNEHMFYADRSSTFMAKMENTERGLTPVSVHLTYGSGEIVGFLVKDTVRFGSTVIYNQSFLIVEDAALPRHRTWDGICGLGWKTMSSAGLPLYRHVQDSGQRAIFTLVPASENQPYIVVGAVPEEVYRPGTLAWARAEALRPGGELSYWVASGGLAIRKSTPTKVRFLVDTGTTFMMAPPKYFMGIVRSIFTPEAFNEQCGMDSTAGNLIVCDCSIMHSDRVLPLRVYLGDRAFVLNARDLFKRVPATDGAELCLLQVQQNPMSAPDPMDIFGGLLGPMGMPPGISSDPIAEPEAAPEDPFGLPFPVPFAIPGMEPRAAGQPDVPMPGGPMGAGEEVDEVINRMPDGRVCRSTKVYENGALKKQETHCDEPNAIGGMMGGRRLQLGLPFEAEGMPLAIEDPMDELFVLGGVFLEHFVAIFDFDQGRVGFAQPVGKAASAALAQRTSGLNAVPLARSPVFDRPVSGHPTGVLQTSLAAVAMMLGGAACAAFYVRTFLRPGAASSSQMGEQELLAVE